MPRELRVEIRQLETYARAGMPRGDFYRDYVKLQDRWRHARREWSHP